MTERVALITGVTGVVGWRLAMHLAARPGWRVVGVSRRPPRREPEVPEVGFVSADLTDPDACRRLARETCGVTHLLNAARFDHVTTSPEPVDTNTAMLANMLEALEQGGHPLQHVHLVQGTKYYGSNLGRFRTPAREDDPRSLQSSFYYEQEDLVIRLAERSRWTWSASRPHGICDRAPGIARSMAMVIAVYALISKELGLPLDFPGTEANWRAVYQCTDAAQLATAIEWMSTTPEAANHAFNITNGDYIRWCNLWPALAEEFGMEPGAVRTVRLADVMADKASVWRGIAERHQLADTPYQDLALWSYGDFLFRPDWDMMSSMTKARQHGFHEVRDTEQMFRDLFASLRRHRVIPA